MNPATFEIAGLRLEPHAARVSVHGRALAATPIDFRLLHFLVTHAERTYSRSQLLDCVWGTDALMEHRVVDHHIRRLRTMLAPSGHDRLIETVRGAGYSFRSA